jgi:ribosome-associated translation inhibitor RaiA
MANWEEIRSGVARAANTTIKKTGELAENASMHVKLARLMSKRDGLFEKLGKLTYVQLRTDESRAEEIAAIVSQIDTLGAQINKQKAKIEAVKAQKAEAKAQKSNEEYAEEVQKIIDDNMED